MIRKISIGVDYKDAMHYTVGQFMRGQTIHAIKQVDSKHYEIYITDSDKVTFLWKSIINVPVVVEYDIEAFSNFERVI
jgi:hypothetical protein